MIHALEPIADAPYAAMKILTSHWEPLTVARSLGVHNAHVYRFRNDDHVSPTLEKALIRKGFIPKPPAERHRVSLECDTAEDAAALRRLFDAHGKRRRVARALVEGRLVITKGECDERR